MKDQRQSVVVGLSDSVPAVLALLRKSHDTEVALEIPSASPLFLTANEFRALQALADLRHLKLIIASDDPLRLQLAAMFKLQIDPADRTTIVPEGSGDALPLFGPELPPLSESEEAEQQEKASEEAVSEISTPEPTTDMPLEPDPLSGRFSPTITLVRSSSTQQRLVVAGIVGAIALLAYLAAYQFLTRATVTLSMNRQPIAQTLAVDVITSGESATGSNPSIVARPVTVPVSTTRRAPATGFRLSGDTPARGVVTLSNPTNEAISVATGTRFNDRINGTTFEFTSSTEVPAATDDGPGFGQADVVSVEKGSVGNREIGFLSGRLENGLYFANRTSAIGGGTDREIKIVTQSDLDTLQTSAKNEMIALASTHPLGSNQVILAPSITIQEPTYTFSAQVGQEATELTVEASGQASAIAYNATELNTVALAALSLNVPDGYVIDPTSVRLSNPTLDAADGTTRLTIQANGSALAILSDERRRQLADEIAGRSVADARAFSESQPEIAGFWISYSPSWLPKRIPTDSDRVTIETR